ncbi:MAG: YidC/Oxa1 family membrane protein insertase [Microthrixaceae bacterium]
MNPLQLLEDPLRWLLDFLHDNANLTYGWSIVVLTVIVRTALLPLVIKQYSSMRSMQMVAPQLKELQRKYKGNRQKLNEELMAFYKENQLNPLGGCLPLLLQAPIFMILFNVIQGLTRVQNGTFNPKHLDTSSPLFQALDPVNEMLAFGVDLAESASSALSKGFVHGLPHLVMVAIVAVSSYYQQKQIQGRNPSAEIPPQQKMLMRLMPAMFVFFAFVSPAALVVYFVTSNLYRIGMQHYITRTLYHGEDSLGAQAHKASLEAKKLRDEHGDADLLPKLGRNKAKAVEAKATETPARKPAKAAVPVPPAPTARTGANRSKKKRKRR